MAHVAAGWKFLAKSSMSTLLLLERGDIFDWLRCYSVGVISTHELIILVWNLVLVPELLYLGISWLKSTLSRTR
jgi:hypothetical protein